MTSPRHGHYIPKDSDSLADVVRVERDGAVWTHRPRLGGLIVPLDADPGFLDRHEPLTGARLKAMLDRREPGHVVGDRIMGGETPVAIPCFLDGHSQGGWTAPEFERAAVDAFIVPSLASGEGARLGYDEATDAYVHVEADNGEAWDFDHASFGQMAVDGEAHEMATAPDGREAMVSVTTYPGRDTRLPDGSTVRTYGIGSRSWRWERVEKPAAAPSP